MPRRCSASPIRWSCAGPALVLRWSCRVYFRRAPDATPLLRWAQTVRPTTVQALIDRVALLAKQAKQAKQAKVTQARKLRVDATVVETPIHSPTDSGLLGDAVSGSSPAWRGGPSQCSRST
jgi:transposase, IS5 family